MKYFFILLITAGFLQAEDLDNLLDTYAYNSDLSKQTKLVSDGTVTIFTRQDLDIMQAHSLKDLLKSHPVVRYKESRSGIADMFYRGSSAMFSSSTIRLYIDNQELVSSTFGSGFTAANNIDLDLMDHVEIYTRSPSYEYSTEATYILIKLYSKTAQRDRGGKLNLNYGTRGFNQQSAYYADELKDFSYVAYASRNDDRKKEYYSHNVPIKRDSESTSFFSSIYTKEHKLQVMLGTSDLDTSIARSPRATYEKSTGHYDYFNVGYETTYFKNFLISLNHQETHIAGENKEATGFESPLSPELGFDRDEHVITAEIKYNKETQNNRLIVGLKHRYKSFEVNKATFNGITLPEEKYTKQSISTVFLENRFNISENNIVGISTQFSIVNNNTDIKDTELFQFRINHTYNYKNFIFKSTLYTVESLIQPYIYIDYGTPRTLDNQVLNTYTGEIKYFNAKHELDFVFTHGVTKNLFTQPPYVMNPGGIFINSNENITNTSSYLEYIYTYDANNKIVSNFSYADIKNFKVKSTAAFIRSLNRIGKFDFFNELVYNRNNKDGINHYDYSAGVKYRYSNYAIFSLKGENIFDKAYEESYFRVDPNTFIQEEPIRISPVEQRFYVSMEYMF